MLLKVHGRTLAWISLSWLCLGVAPVSGQPAADRLQARDAALAYLSAAEDEFTGSVGVYTEPDAGGTLFWPSWWLNGGRPPGLTLDAECGERPHGGAACLRLAWDGRAGQDGHHWTGVIFHDSPTYERTGPGHDLSAARSFTLWYRVTRLDGTVRFVLGLAEEPLGARTIAVVDEASLRRDGGVGRWIPLTVDLTGLPTKAVHTALQIILDAGENPRGGGTVVDLDDAVFAGPPEVLLQLPRSYPVRLGEDFRWTHNAAHVYDSALVALAHMARGTPDDMRRAGTIIRTLDYCLTHDRTLMGQLRNAYSAGPIALVPGGATRLNSWWDPAPGAEVQREDYYSVGSTTGNTAWGALAAVEYAGHVTGPEREVAVHLARELMIWLEGRLDPAPPLPGFRGGFEDWEPQTEARYGSTEHNLDVYAVARRYAELWPEGDPERARGSKMARVALDFVNAMWDEGDGRFLTGTTPDGTALNREPRQSPTDVNAWAALALGPNDRTRRAMVWVERECRATDPVSGLSGYDFNNDQDGIWWEGTAHDALAFAVLGDREREARAMDQLVAAQRRSACGGGIFAASKDKLTTGFDIKVATPGEPVTRPWVYYALPHAGATAWLALAAARWNPYEGRAIAAP